MKWPSVAVQFLAFMLDLMPPGFDWQRAVIALALIGSIFWVLEYPS